MQRRGASSRIGYGGAVAYELRGVYRMTLPADFNGFTTPGDRTYYDQRPRINEELERQAFEEVIRKLGFNDFLVEYGNYVNFTVQTAWVVWQRARAKQENNDE